MTVERDEFRVEIGSATAGRLVFTRGASDLKLSATDSPEELYRARFEGNTPDVRVEEGIVTIEYPNTFNPLKWQRTSADIRLNPTIPWEIEARGGAAGVRADLTHLQVKGFKLTGGASSVTVDLPAASGRVPVEVVGGVNDLTIRRPRSVAASLTITGGATDLTLDDQQFGAIGGRVSLKSAGHDDAEGRYEVSVTGGANGVSVTTL